MPDARIALVVTMVFAFSGLARADFTAFVTAAAATNLRIKTKFQRELRDIVVAQRPDLEALATLNMALQIAYGEARRARLLHLMEHDPARIDAAHGLVRFSNFDWSDDDAAAIMSDPAYADIESRVRRLREENDGHPSWPAMREFFRAEMMGSPEYQALMARFQQQQEDLETELARCRSD